MSLVQHVSSLEGVDREPEVDVREDFRPRAIARKISYDVLQPPKPPVAEQTQKPLAPSTPAYKHSVAKRLGR